MWQVAGLALLLYVGSPQSREGDERKEAKLDAILEALDADGGKKKSRPLTANIIALNRFSPALLEANTYQPSRQIPSPADH